MGEQFAREPSDSASNPEGIDERRILARMFKTKIEVRQNQISLGCRKGTSLSKSILANLLE